MDILSVIIFSTIIGVVVFIIIQLKASDRKKQLISAIKEKKDFNSSKEFIGNDCKSILAIDENSNTLCLATYENKQALAKIYTYRDLLETEILEDGESLTKTNRGSQLGGALLGGLMLGGIGAILGGLSGSKRNIDKVSRVDLKVIVNDEEKPLFLLNFLESSDGEEKDSFFYKVSIRQAREINALLTVLIKKADYEDRKNEKSVEVKNHLSITDDIEKLYGLKEKGIITEDEFTAKKQKLLNI